MITFPGARTTAGAVYTAIRWLAVDLKSARFLLRFLSCAGLCALSSARAAEPADEAARLQGDAESALRASHWREAGEAAESAWARGRHSAAVLALRVRGESAVAFPPSLSGGVNWPVDYEKEKVEPESLGERLASAAKAVALFAQWREEATPKRPAAEFAELGATVLLSGSRLLRCATEQEPSLTEHGPAIADLRRLMRETAAAVQGAATADEADDKGHFYLLTATYLPYWYEKPAEAVAAWRELLARRFTGRNRMNLYATVRGQLLDRQAGGQEYDKLPWLVAWHGEAPAELRKLWSDFRDSLLESKNQIEVLDGRLLETADVVGNDRYQNSPVVGSLFEQVWTSREALLQEGLAYEYLWTVLTGGLGAFHSARASLEKRWLIYYLDNTKRDDFQIMGAIWQVDGLTHEEGVELYQHWLAHQKRLALKPDFYAANVNRLLQKFPDLAGPPPADAITVKQFWYPPELGEVSFHAVERPVWAEGHLWLSLVYNTPNPKIGYDFHYRILELEVPSLRVIDRIEAPGEGLAGLLLVQPDALYSTNNLIGQPKGIRRYDRKTKEWSMLPLPEQSYGWAYADDERLVAAYEDYEGSGESGIVQWTKATGEATVLASNRRRPAQNQFDDCKRYDIRHVFAAPDGAPAVIIDDANRNEHAYTYDAATKRWNPFLPTTFRVLAQSLDTATLFVSPECGVGLIRAKGEPIEPWFVSRFPKPAEPFKPSAPAELKEIAVDIFPIQPMALAAGKLWTMRMKPAPGGAGEIMMLAAFDHDKLLMERPIRFEVSKEADRLWFKHVTTDETKPPIDTYLDLIGTDAGLFFRRTPAPGYWFLPIGEVDFGPAETKPK